MDVWGPSRVCGQDQVRYFLLVVDDYTRYTMVFPLESKADVRGVLIDWIIAVHRQVSARFQQDLQVLRQHSDRGGDFSSGLLQEFFRAEGIIQDLAYTALDGGGWQCDGISGLGCALPCPQYHRGQALFSHSPPRLPWLPTDASPWQFYHPTLRRILSSLDVTFDESVCFYRLHPHMSSPQCPPPLFLIPGPPSVDPLPPQGIAPSGVSQVDPPPLVEPLEVSFDTSGPAEGGDCYSHNRLECA
ncbi:unnamed protein product [Closterium sp. NIES-53]